MDNLVRKQIPVSNLEIGMTVEYNGILYTVSRRNINKNEHGVSFNGDASIKFITLVQFAVPTAFGIVLR